MRWQDNNRALANDSNDWNWHREIKEISLGRSVDLSFGGEIREQFRYYSHLNFGDVPAGANDEDIYLQHRFLLHSDILFGKFCRIFLQVNSCHANGRNSDLHQVDRDDLGLMQAFADLNMGTNLKIQFRLGRQEFSYGMERILALRDGPTIRQNFDGVRVSFSYNRLNIDVLAAKPVLYKTGVFDNKWRRKDYFLGSYITTSVLDKNTVDLYYFNASFNNAVFAS
ncbi:MAG TPA: alginate export family protein, partial [Bacteroidales bacterium]|nr:alginate export family protein [Bacteroidales bacterium]